MYGWTVAVLSNIYFVLRREDTSKKTATTDYDGPILPSFLIKANTILNCQKWFIQIIILKKMRK